ncbi:hypothetical protein SAMN04487897_11277 [Paenibacillus sp. yr247]|nr:hypothetical protein SAMN04487897_11277 [Paenibacillus sp. yr247]
MSVSYYNDNGELKEREYTACQNHIYDVLRPYFQSILPTENEYSEAFDQFDFLLGLALSELKNGCGPIGRFGWGHASHQHITEFFQNGSRLGEDWGVVRDLFNGDRVKFVKVLTGYEQFINQYGWGSPYNITQFFQE